MKEINLFLDKNKNWVTNIELFEKLKKIGAHDCEILYIHSSLSFGMPNNALKKKELLDELFNVLLRLNVRTLCMPTFTFSFCNGKEFNPTMSKSKMGTLNEFFRVQENVVRSIDPLMSVALLGEDKDIVTGIGKESIGVNSTFDKLRHRDKVKFLFLGTKIGDCFTYMHYLEWLYKVDYRYDKIFKGIIQNGNKVYEDEFSLFVRYKEVKPNLGSYSYEQIMYDKGIAKMINFGDSTISIVEEKAAADAYKNCLDLDPNYFVTLQNQILEKDKTFELQSEMIAL